MSLTLKDSRIPEVRSIVDALVGKADKESDKGITEVLVLDTQVAIFVDKTVLFIVPLKAPNTTALPRPNIAFRYCDIINFEDKECYIFNSRLHDKLFSSYQIYTGYLHNSPRVASDCKLRDNVEFEKMLALKSSEGMKFYTMLGDNPNDKYLVPMFSGLPNLNKGDDIGISVYDLLDGHLMIDMEIFKKKINRNIELIYRTLKL